MTTEERDLLFEGALMYCIDQNEFLKGDWIGSELKTVVVVDKSTLSRRNNAKRVEEGKEAFDLFVKRAGIELLAGDEIHNYKGSGSGAGSGP